MRQILFSYREEPTNNFLGTDGSGDEVVIFRDGSLEYRHFFYAEESPVAVDSHPANPGLAQDVRKILEENRSALEQLPSFVDNGCCDGTWDLFHFFGRDVAVDNLWDEVDAGWLSVLSGTEAESPEGQKLSAQNRVLAKVRGDVAAALEKYRLSLLREYPYWEIAWDAPCSCRDMLQELCRRFRAAGMEAADLEARELICFAAGISKREFQGELCRKTNPPVPPEVAERVRELAERHLAGEPVPYLIGEWDFYGLTLRITPCVLIPRPDTEVLAEQAIAFCRTQPSVRVLDLCAGSGCIGLAIASQVSRERRTEVVLGELSDGALEICRQNVCCCGLEAQVSVRKLDALRSPPADLGMFSCMVCNPPYIPTGDIAGLDSSVRDYEPYMALNGGADGLDFYRSIAERWKTVLDPGGRLYLEVGIGQAESVAALLTQAGFQNVRIVPDWRGIPRVVSGERICPSGA